MYLANQLLYESAKQLSQQSQLKKKMHQTQFGKCQQKTIVWNEVSVAIGKNYSVNDKKEKDP